MKSYTTLRNLYGSTTGRTTSTDLTLGDQRLNDGYKFVLSRYDWPFLYKQKVISTVASQQFYDIPAEASKLVGLKVTVGSTQYVPREITSQEEWDRINQSTSTTSDTPEYFYILKGQVGFWPTPASTTASAITFTYKRQVKDLSKADYTTGGILTATLDSQSIVGTGTTWTAGMVGSWLRITATDAANVGDGLWYEIDTFTSTTAISLDKPYLGTSITAGNAAYTIGQMPILPETYHILPLYYALYQHYLEKGEMNRAKNYKGEFNEGIAQLFAEFGSQSDSVVLDYGRKRYTKNPNLYLQG